MEFHDLNTFVFDFKIILIKILVLCGILMEFLGGDLSGKLLWWMFWQDVRNTQENRRIYDREDESLAKSSPF